MSGRAQRRPPAATAVAAASPRPPRRRRPPAARRAEVAELLARPRRRSCPRSDTTSAPLASARRRVAAGAPIAAVAAVAATIAATARHGAVGDVDGARPGSGETLPFGSTSSTRTSTSSPRLKTSSTLSMRLPPPILEMWSRPSRPGRMFTNAPNLVMFTTRPGYTAPTSAVGGLRMSLICRSASSIGALVDGADRDGADHAVVVDGDVGAGLGLDGVDDLALRPDDLADLVDRDLEADDLRGGLADLGAGLGDGLLHDLEDRQAGLLGLLQRLGQDVGREAVDLGVELQGGDEVARAGDLEVHVAEGVLGAEDVGEGGVLAARRR